MEPHIIIRRILEGQTIEEIKSAFKLPTDSRERLNWWRIFRACEAVAREFAPRDVYKVVAEACDWAIPTTKEGAK